MSIKATNMRKCVRFSKKGKRTPRSHIILMKITPSNSAYQRTPKHRFQAPISKNVEFSKFCQKKDYGFICLLFVCFPQGDFIDPVGLDRRERAHSNKNESSSAFFEWSKNCRAASPPPTPLFSQNRPIKILRWQFCSA